MITLACLIASLICNFYRMSLLVIILPHTHAFLSLDRCGCRCIPSHLYLIGPPASRLPSFPSRLYTIGPLASSLPSFRRTFLSLHSSRALLISAVTVAIVDTIARSVLLRFLPRVGTPMKDPNLSAGDDTMKMGIVDDYLCAICDDGGLLVCCEGECGRLFHPNSCSGEASNCRSLELKDDQWKPKTSNFLCKNCEHKRHQCYFCGMLGSSEMSSGSPEVLKCQKKYCGRFYHPKCLLNYDRSKSLQGFECPLHECHSCKHKGRTIQAEKEKETYLVQCRRCPVAYHRKCLPRDISNVANGEVSRTFKIGMARGPRLWFFYCRKHEMVGELNSATRDHLKFPEKPVVFNFDLNEKLPEETEAPEPNASTSSALMESSASRPSSACQLPGISGWLEPDD